jgi:hypothetical protein
MRLSGRYGRIPEYPIFLAMWNRFKKKVRRPTESSGTLLKKTGGYRPSHRQVCPDDVLGL